MTHVLIHIIVESVQDSTIIWLVVWNFISYLHAEFSVLFRIRVPHDVATLTYKSTFRITVTRGVITLTYKIQLTFFLNGKFVIPYKDMYVSLCY